MERSAFPTSVFGSIPRPGGPVQYIAPTITINMASRGGKKRAATQSTEPSTSTNHQSKKTRFVEPSEDPATFAEHVDSALEGPSRKGKVKTEGYDSDSTDDGEGVVSSRKKGEDDELEDMFATENGGNEEPNVKERFMRLADIEGQEFGNESGSGNDSDGDDEPEDEDDAERKKKSGMGFELSSFNMREEMEEGKFTEDGSYVRTFDPHGVHDRWMDGLDEGEIKLARRRKREQERRQKERILAEEKEREESGGQHALEQQLLGFLKKGETVLESLQRLGSQTKKAQTMRFDF
jgi:CD2 antigen cytoplasmic tail-binding protein 2